MPAVATQYPNFDILNTDDDCPDSGMPTLRQAALYFVHEESRFPAASEFHMCYKSADIDFPTELNPLIVHAISLHKETWQNIPIANYVSSAVSSNERMKPWREDKNTVVEKFSESADGI
jgi:hypothetical protein